MKQRQEHLILDRFILRKQNELKYVPDVESFGQKKLDWVYSSLTPSASTNNFFTKMSATAILDLNGLFAAQTFSVNVSAEIRIGIRPSFLGWTP